MDLRLLGLGLSRQSVAQLARDTQPWLLASLVVMLCTGILLLMCFATKYYYLTAFWVKLVSLCLVLVFTGLVHRRAVMMDETKSSPIRTKVIALISLSLWTIVVLSGRLIGFP